MEVPAVAAKSMDGLQIPEMDGENPQRSVPKARRHDHHLRWQEGSFRTRAWLLLLYVAVISLLGWWTVREGTPLPQALGRQSEPEGRSTRRHLRIAQRGPETQVERRTAHHEPEAQIDQSHRETSITVAGQRAEVHPMEEILERSSQEGRSSTPRAHDQTQEGLGKSHCRAEWCHPCGSGHRFRDGGRAIHSSQDGRVFGRSPRENGHGFGEIPASGSPESHDSQPDDSANSAASPTTSATHRDYAGSTCCCCNGGNPTTGASPTADHTQSHQSGKWFGSSHAAIPCKPKTRETFAIWHEWRKARSVNGTNRAWRTRRGSQCTQWHGMSSFVEPSVICFGKHLKEVFPSSDLHSIDLFAGTDRGPLFPSYGDFDAFMNTFLISGVLRTLAGIGKGALCSVFSFIGGLTLLQVVQIDVAFAIIIGYLLHCSRRRLRKKLGICRFVASRRHTAIPLRHPSIKFRVVLFAVLLCGHEATSCVRHIQASSSIDTLSMTVGEEDNFVQSNRDGMLDLGTSQRVRTPFLQKGTSIQWLPTDLSSIRHGATVLTSTHWMHNGNDDRALDIRAHLLHCTNCFVDDEVLFLMARSARQTQTLTGTMSALDRVRVYRKNVNPEIVVLPPQATRQYYRSIFAHSPELHIPHFFQDHFLVYSVLPPPKHDYDSLFDAFILAMPPDIIPGCSLILYHRNPAPATAMHNPAHGCQVRNVPYCCDRDRFILALGLYDTCGGPARADRCRIIVAGIPWDPGDQQWRYILDGMYVEVRTQLQQCHNPVAHRPSFESSMQDSLFDGQSLMQVGPLLHFQGVLFLRFTPDEGHDLLKTYLQTRYPETLQRRLIGIHGWHVHYPGQIFTSEYYSHPFQDRYSWTNTFLTGCEAYRDAEELVIADVRPLPPPLTFRDNGITLMSMPATRYREGYTAYLIDCHVDRSVRRLAVVVRQEATFFEVCSTLLLGHLARASDRFLKIYYKLSSHTAIFGPGDTIKLPFGSFMTLFSYHFDNCIPDDLHIIEPDDAAIFMQRSLRPCFHGHYPDYLLWQRAQPYSDMVLVSTWYHPWLYTEYYLQNERYLTLRRQECLRCRIQTLWSDYVGRRPITLIPLRTMNGLAPPRNAIAVLTVDDQEHRLCFIEYHYQLRWQFGTLLFQFPGIYVPLDLLFNRAEPQNECRNGALCRGEIDDLVIWWPGAIPVYEGAWIRLFEIPQPDDDDMSHSTLVPQQDLTNESCTSDTSSVEYEGSELLQLATYLFHRTPVTGLPPPGNPDLNSLDEIVWIDDKQTVVDFPTRRPLPTPCRAPPRLPLAEQGVYLPDLRVLVDCLLAQCESPQIDWQSLLPILPADLHYTFADLILDPAPTMPSLHIYTDGSFIHGSTDQQAAWAFVALTYFQNETYLVDFGYGLVETNELEAGWTGARSQGPREAELDALIRAIEWTLRMAYAVPTTFHFDSILAGNVASGLFQATPNDMQSKLLRNLALALQTFAGKDFPLDWEHVPAHQGYFGNEMADAIAKFAHQQQKTCPTYQHIDYMPHIVGPTPTISWLWYYFRTFDGRSDLPDELLDLIPLPQTTRPLTIDHVAPPHIIRAATPLDDSPQAYVRFQLSILDFNATTLNETDGRKKQYVVPVYLRDQLVAHQAHITFLQETRATKSCVIDSSTHTRIVSESINGRGGTEIWFQRYIGKNNSVAIRSKDIIVLHADAELLIAKCHYNGFPLICVSAHAPHTGRPPQVHDEFWAHLTDLLRALDFAQHDLLIGVDANAHFDCELPPHVGGHGLELRTNYAAEKFHNFLVEFQLYLPSTFEHTHYGDTWTWCGHSCRTYARCDYIAIPLAWQNSKLSSYNVYTLDVGNKSIDHVPIALDVSLVFTKRRNTAATKPQFDRRRFQHTDTKQLRELFSDLPDVSWTCSVDEHATQLAKSISDKLVQAFPTPKHSPKKSYITDETWRLRGERIWHTRKLRAAKSQLSELTLREAFSAFEAYFTYQTEAILATALKLLFTCLHHGTALKFTASRLHTALRADRTAYVTSIAEQAERLPGKFLHQQLRQLGVAGKAKQRNLRPLPILSDLEGRTLQSLDTIAARWHDFFEEQEDGFRVTLDNLVQEHLDTVPTTPLTPDWTELFSLQDLETQFRSTQCNRAYFDDGIPGDLLHSIPDVLARAYFPLFTKISLLQQEPMIFKGGLLTPAYKGKGSPNECNAYRSLLVSSPIGKALHALLRRAAVHHFHRIAQPFQIGGLPGKSITQATHSLLAYQWAAKQRKLSTGFIFIDITNAFYRVLRQHITTTSDSRGVHQLFTSLGLPETAYEEFATLLASTPAFSQSDMSPYLERMLSETLRGTWFTVANSTMFSRTRRGTRPGDSLADLCFTYALAKILGQAFEQLPTDDLTTFYWDGNPEPTATGPLTSEINILCPIWADDIAIAMAHRCPAQLVANLTSIAKRVFTALATAGMTPNFKVGKTEAILDLHGAGAKQQLRTLMSTDMTIPIESLIFSATLRVVGRYKHLGTWITTGIKMTYDLRCKFAIAHSTITKYRTAIFANVALPVLRKVQLFRSLILSGITFSIGAWHLLRPPEYRCFLNGIFRLYKRIAVLHFGTDALKWSHDKLCHELSLEKPDILLAIGRLRYLQQLIRQGQAQLWGLLQQCSEWWQCIYTHFDWLQTRVPHLSCPHPCTDWMSFYQFLRAPGNRWKGLLKKAQYFDILYHSLHYQWNCWHHDILHRYAELSAIPSLPSLLGGGYHFCLQCRQHFDKAAALAVHAFKKHGRVTEARHYASGTQCTVCLKHYSTYSSLVNHLKYSQGCLTQLRARGPLLAPEPGLNSRHELTHRQALHLPHIQAEGPSLPPLTIQDTPCPETLQLHEAWNRAWIPHLHASSPVKLAALRDATKQTSLPRADILRALDVWLCDLSEELCTLDTFVVVEDYRGRCTFQWFFPEIPMPQEEYDLDRVLQHCLHAATPPCLPSILTVAYKPVCFAHLFSGHRRPHDIQSYVEQWTGCFSSAKVLSVDIIFDLDTADLTDPEKLQLFIRAIREGLLQAIVAGPPCETWSVARESNDEGPRPLRDANNLLGKPSLTKRELQQVSIGNQLLGATLRLFLEALCTKTFALIEHPSEPNHRPTAPSIWKLPIIQLYLLRHPGCQMVHLFQGLFGAASAKPTQFLLANALDGAFDYLHLYQTSVVLPQYASIGKTAEGTWKTMSLKAYPPALCRAIVSLAEASLARSPWREPPNDPAWFHAAIENLCCSFNYEVGMGPDFAG